MRVIVPILLACVIFSCNSEHAKKDAQKDTLALVNIAFTSPQFYRTLGNNKIYVLKTKFYNKSWPADINGHHISYIDDSLSARQVSTRLHIDNRMRYAITDFKIEGDSAFVMLEHFSTPIYFKYYLRKKNSKWSITHLDWAIR